MLNNEPEPVIETDTDSVDQRCVEQVRTPGGSGDEQVRTPGGSEHLEGSGDKQVRTPGGSGDKQLRMV